MSPTTILAVSAAAVLVACAGSNTEDELRARLEGFFEAVLTGDSRSLDDYVSDSCLKKAEFLELIGEATVLESADITVPEGAFSFDFDNGVVVAKRIRDSQPLLLNDEILEDDPANATPLKFVEEGGAWRLENCGA